MKISSILFLLLSAFLITACASTTSKAEIEGTEGNICYKNKTCNEGLICENNTCLLDKCFASNCPNSWEECSLETGLCVAREGFCSDDNDCNLEENQKCNFEHKCLSDLCSEVNCSMDLNSECNNDTGSCDCKEDFHNEAASNICFANTKKETCKTLAILNSQVIVSEVTITWNKESNSWNPSPDCEWSCKDGYSKSKTEENTFTCEECTCNDREICGENKSCTLSANRCNTNSDCTIQNQECSIDFYCINKESPCDNQECNNNGTCIVSDNQAICECNLGYKNNGNLSCISVCTDINCGGHGECIVSEGEASCNCDLGYELLERTSLECVNIDDCTPNPCLHDGECIDKVNSHICLCFNNWTGDNCELEVPCNGTCENWEYCSDDTCKPEPGRCNRLTDCINSLCMTKRLITSTSPPPIDEDCTCNQNTHFCEMNEVQP